MTSEFLNVFVYSDSLAFRRPEQSQDLQFTYPFVLQRLIESRLGVRANLVMRGSPGATIVDVHAMLVRDTGYFGSDDQALNIAAIQCGIVDCAPRPFTYAFVPALRAVPFAGKRLLGVLVKNRPVIQQLGSYRAISKRRFANEYRALVETCAIAKMRPIAIGMPLPTDAIEQRSPGFTANVRAYNELIRQAVADAYCDVEARIPNGQRQAYLLDDGHHLTELGHRLFAESALVHIGRMVGGRSSADPVLAAAQEGASV
jgi:hypothetical protein